MLPIKTFEEILHKFATFEFKESFDMIVAIANGGIIPAAIINQKLNLELQLLKLNLRDEAQNLKYDTPQLLEPINFIFKNKKILLVEDRIKTGTTVKMAQTLLEGASVIKTFAVNGSADYYLYNENCFKFPWIV